MDRPWKEGKAVLNIEQKLTRLREICKKAKKVLVVVYGNPDPDALASGLALKKILATKKRTVTIGYTGAIGRPENAAMMWQLKIKAIPLAEAETSQYDVIALVDSQPQFFTDFKLSRCDIVIDHHPIIKKHKVGFADIRPNYLSTSSIMTEYLKAADIVLTRNLASALFYGIKTDMRHFMGEMSYGDIEAVKWLRQKADRYIVNQIEFSQFTGESLDYFGIALVRRRFINGVMFTHLGPVPFSDICVQVADFLIRVENVAWALVTGIVADTLVIVFRNDGIKKDAGYLARTAFDNIGSAGGHKSMGRAEIKQNALPQALLLTNNRGIEEFVLDSLAKLDPVFLPIQKSVRV